MGSLFLEMDKTDNALTVLNKAFSLLQKEQNNGFSLGNAYLTLGKLKIKTNRLKEAITHLGKARTLFDANNVSGKFQGRLQYTYGLYFNNLKDFDQSQHYFLKAIDVFKASNTVSYDLAECYQAMADMYQDQRLSDKANEYYLMSLAAYERISNKTKAQIVQQKLKHLND
jgi:tetratricopeptide (TPR) repeat protein